MYDISALEVDIEAIADFHFLKGAFEKRKGITYRDLKFG
jgi:hypothetical protein